MRPSHNVDQELQSPLLLVSSGNIDDCYYDNDNNNDKNIIKCDFCTNEDIEMRPTTKIDQAKATQNDNSSNKNCGAKDDGGGGGGGGIPESRSGVSSAGTATSNQHQPLLMWSLPSMWTSSCCCCLGTLDYWLLQCFRDMEEAHILWEQQQRLDQQEQEDNNRNDDASSSSSSSSSWLAQQHERFHTSNLDETWLRAMRQRRRKKQQKYMIIAVGVALLYHMRLAWWLLFG